MYNRYQREFHGWRKNWTKVEKKSGSIQKNKRTCKEIRNKFKSKCRKAFEESLEKKYQK